MACGEDAVCISIAETVALVKWRAELKLVTHALDGCSLIEWVEE